MKKILFAILAGALVVSCDLTGSYSQTIPIYASFEYTDVKYEADSLFYKSELGAGYGWQYLAFYHKVDTASWVFNGGMMLSSKKGRLYNAADSAAMARTDSLAFAEDRFRVHSAKDANSNSYLVHYTNPDSALMPAHDIEFLAGEFGTCQAYQCFVNNTSYVAYKVAQTFEPGDRLTLKATGYLNGSKTGEASIALAEYTTVKDSIMSTWTAFDLSKLQLFDFIDFEVVSTKKEVPAYFCLDYFMASVSLGNE